MILREIYENENPKADLSMLTEAIRQVSAGAKEIDSEVKKAEDMFLVAEIARRIKSNNMISIGAKYIGSVFGREEIFAKTKVTYKDRVLLLFNEFITVLEVNDFKRGQFNADISIALHNSTIIDLDGKSIQNLN
jgi:hypothetical protein